MGREGEEGERGEGEEGGQGEEGGTGGRGGGKKWRSEFENIRPSCGNVVETLHVTSLHQDLGNSIILIPILCEAA